ncbi:response regulator [Hymenobacter sp. ASUV-10]|uniref:Response regulator n=1 Tax=Hymenobacter aranciens TaxID=3063996 RepID=A0ABT9BGN2_9BACT|nr:response regulator [Hymenobacter sp. ASUV-10]MDO7877425.1 response regulator [Hymenobacter sp. ASUV-10]
MSPVRVLLVEDEVVFSELLTMHLEDLGYEVLGPYPTAAEAQPVFHAQQPDLLLFDVGLRGEIDGIELARELLAAQPTPLIFITAFTDRETFDRARTVAPSAYLNKPFTALSVQSAVELALQNFVRPDAAAEPDDEPITHWATDMLVRDAFFLKERNMLVKVRQQDVLWIEADGRYSMLVRAGGRKHALRITLRDLAASLPPSSFVQVHRSVIINADHLEQVDPVDGTVTVSGHALPLGRSYKDLLLRRLQQVGEG